MEDKNNGLMKSNNSIFKRIINWFKNIFKKPTVSDNKETKENNIKLESSKQPENKPELIYDYGSEETILEDEPVLNEKQNSEKQRFFELYNNVKDGKIDVKDLSMEDLKKYNAMIREEVSLKFNKLEGINQENEELLDEIKKLNKKTSN